MKLTLIVISVSLVTGILLGGRLTSLSSVRVRWPFLAPLGLGLQMAPVPGRVLAMTLLFASFAVLLVFGLANRRLAGFGLVLAGMALNLTVIAVNGGMPVTRHALVASGQADTLSFLVHDGGAKHHLARLDDHLLFLGDVIPIPVADQVASAGDLVTFAGIAWLIVSSMRWRPEEERPRPALDATTGTAVADALG
jgi:hypothetical protein